MQKTLDFYKDVLTSMRYSVDNDGLISITTATGVLAPAVVDGKRLVLPTKAWLKKGFGEDFQGFHPLAESMARRGTSPVLQHMQRNARAQLSFTYTFLAQQLLKVAADVTLHKELPPSANEFLKKMQSADKKLIETLEKLIKAAAHKNRLITVYLKNGGTYQGKKVNRLAVIRFPLIELLETEEPKVLGVEVKPKQRQALLTLLRSILPAGDDPEEYSAGSNNRVAPYLHSFLQAYLKVITQLNKIIARYGKPMALPVKPFQTYAEETLSKFADIYDEIPALTGNEGQLDEEEDEVVAAEPKTGIKVAPARVENKTIPVVKPGSTPVTVAAPLRHVKESKEDDNTVDFETMRQALMPKPVQMPVQQSPYGQVQSHVALPWQQPVQQQVQPQNPFAQVAQQQTMVNQMPVNNPYAGGMVNQMPMQQPNMGGPAVGYAANSLV